MSDRLYKDMSISEVRLCINMINRSLQYIKNKNIDNPFREKDYKLFQDCVRLIEKLNGSRWTKEYY